MISRAVRLFGVCLLSGASFGCETVNDMETGGGRYTGQTVFGTPNGNGRLVLRDGSVYEGEFQNGLAEGQGTLTARDGCTSYTGLFAGGIPVWTGVITLCDGTRIPIDLSEYDVGGLTAEEQAEIDAIIEVNREPVSF